MPEDPPSNSDIVANLDRTIVEASAAAALAAQQVQNQIGSAEDLEPLRAYTNLVFFITQVDLDIRVLLRNLASDPAARISSEKYLALALIEAERGVGILLNKVRVAASIETGRMVGFFDLSIFQPARDAFDATLLEMRQDRGFNDDLTLIRNEVVAHFVSKESGVENSAAWAVSRAALPTGQDAMLSSKIVEYSVKLSLALRELSAGLTASMQAYRAPGYSE